VESENHESILGAMGSLEDYLAGKQEQTGTFGLVEDPTSPTGFKMLRDADGAAVWAPPGQNPQTYVAPQQPQPIPQVGPVPGTTPFSQPVAPPRTEPAISPEQFQAMAERVSQMEEAALQLSRERLEADDKAFIASLSAPQADGSYLSEEQQLLLMADRYIEQLTTSNDAMAQRMQQEEQNQDAQDQQVAKQIVAYRKAVEQHKLPWTVDIRDHLMDLPTPEAMDRYLGQLTRFGIGSFARAQAAQPQAVQARGVINPPLPVGASPAPRPRNEQGRFVAAGARGTTPGTPTQGNGSGGLGALLASRPYIQGE
jgi:hypothetical protein